MKKICLFIAIIIISHLIILFPADNNTFQKNRINMVNNQIEHRGIDNDEVLSSMKKVPRHEFVPDSLKKYAYQDRPLPIGYGQTISQPFIVALMTQLLKVDNNSKILEVGTGSGYQAAVLSEIANKVYTVEIIDSLYNKSTRLLENLNYVNIKTKNSDGYFGWKKYAPYDGIIVTCASEFIPPPLLKQLKIGGRMIIPVGPPFQIQHLILVKREEKNLYTSQIVTQVRFVPMVRRKD